MQLYKQRRALFGRQRDLNFRHSAFLFMPQLYTLILLFTLNACFCIGGNAGNNCTLSSIILNEKLSNCKTKCFPVSAPSPSLSLQCKKENLRLIVQTLVDEGFNELDALELKNYSNLTDIEDNLFQNLTIRRLDLSHNGIYKIGPLAFSGLENTLEHLNLNSNKLSSQALISLTNLGNLKILDLSTNNLTIVQEGAFVSNTKLINLNLARNGICSLPQNALNETKQQMEYLNLAENCLAFVPASNLRNFQKLIHLSLRSNRIRGRLANLQFMNMPRLKELDLSHNSLTGFSPLTFMNVPNLETLNLATNEIDDLKLARLQSFERLVRLDLSANKMNRVPSFSFKDMKNTDFINLDRNNIKILETFAFSSLPKLQSLTLQNNELEVIQKNSFDSLINLKRLILSNNNIGYLDAGMLAGMPQLRHLNLHNNRIALLDTLALQPVPQLSLLDLGSNRIDHLPQGAFASNTELFWLDLSSNQLQKLNKNAFGSKTANILLQGNPWNCSNDSIDWFIDYLVSYNVKTFFSNQAEVTCSNPEELRGKLLKDLMIKKANDTYFKSLSVGLSSVTNTKGPAIDQSLLAANPYLSGINLSKISPQVVDYVLKGGTVPGIPPDVTRQLVQWYLQQQKQAGAVTVDNNFLDQSKLITYGPSQSAIGPVFEPSNESVLVEQHLLNTIPAIGSLSPQIIGHVMKGGLIPGFDRNQTDVIKNRYLQYLLNSSPNNFVQSYSSNKPLANIDASANNPNSMVANVGSFLTTDQQTPLASAPGTNYQRSSQLSDMPPGILDLLINKEPTIFAQLVEKLLQNKIDQSSASSANSTFQLVNNYANGSASNLGPYKFNNVIPTRTLQVHTYDVNVLDLQADLALANYENTGTNLGGWYTGVGLTVVGLVTTLLMVVLCYRRKRRIAAEKEADGAKLCSMANSKSSVESLNQQSNNSISNNSVKVEDLLNLEANCNNNGNDKRNQVFRGSQNLNQAPQVYNPRPYFYGQTLTRTNPMEQNRIIYPSNNIKSIAYQPWSYTANSSAHLTPYYSKTEI